MKYQSRDLSPAVPRRLRQSMTDAEQMLWAIFRGRAVARHKFRRQHRIGRTILDFYCPALHVAFELDGEPHFTDEGRAADASRDAWLKSQGILVDRFENCDVIANPRRIEEKIVAVLRSRARKGKVTRPLPRPA